MSEYTIKPLSVDNWDAFARFVETHNGVWGGCWRTFFHPTWPARAPGAEGSAPTRSSSSARRGARRARLRRGRRRRLVPVRDTGRAAGRPTPEGYEAGLQTLPDYLITCFFVGTRYRRKGVAAVALRGALDLISQAGGGVVESYPQDTQGKKTSASFLYNATRSMFGQAGLTYPGSHQSHRPHQIWGPGGPAPRRGQAGRAQGTPAGGGGRSARPRSAWSRQRASMSADVAVPATERMTGSAAIVVHEHVPDFFDSFTNSPSSRDPAR
jgi:hypothetical protein